MTTRLSFFLPIGKFFICLCIKTCNFLCCAPNFGRTSPLNPLSCPPRCGKLSSAISERRIHGGSSIFPLVREGAHEGRAPFRRAAGRTHALGQSNHDILSAAGLCAKYGDGACMTSGISAVLRPGGLLSRRHQKRAKRRTCSLSDLKSARLLFRTMPLMENLSI